jgi:hypothetical protein
MRYWWVNQNQTFKQEIGRGYLWSPKRNANQSRNPFYEAMREVAPGDLVFSFVDTRIAAIGIASSYCYESPKPEEFGEAGPNWEAIGWRVRVRFTRLAQTVRPKDHIDVLRHVLPSRYSPLQANGNGNQGVYLTELPIDLAEVLIGLIGPEAEDLRALGGGTGWTAATQTVTADMEVWDHHLESEIQTNTDIPSTEREALIMARRGQGIFKDRVMQIERRCRITLVDNPAHLRASHAKPWRDATNEERLSGENGLLLTPSIDHLFDRGFITFEDSGRLVISPVADLTSLCRMGIPTSSSLNVGTFTQGQRTFLEYHRNSVFLQALRN